MSMQVAGCSDLPQRVPLPLPDPEQLADHLALVVNQLLVHGQAATAATASLLTAVPEKGHLNFYFRDAAAAAAGAQVVRQQGLGLGADTSSASEARGSEGGGGEASVSCVAAAGGAGGGPLECQQQQQQLQQASRQGLGSSMLHDYVVSA